MKNIKLRKSITISTKKFLTLSLKGSIINRALETTLEMKNIIKIATFRTLRQGTSALLTQMEPKGI